MIFLNKHAKFSEKIFCMMQIFSWFFEKHMQKSNLFFLMQMQKRKVLM